MIFDKVLAVRLFSGVSKMYLPFQNEEMIVGDLKDLLYSEIVLLKDITCEGMRLVYLNIVLRSSSFESFCL